MAKITVVVVKYKDRKTMGYGINDKDCSDYKNTIYNSW